MASTVFDEDDDRPNHRAARRDAEEMPQRERLPNSTVTEMLVTMNMAESSYFLTHYESGWRSPEWKYLTADRRPKDMSVEKFTKMLFGRSFEYHAVLVYQSVVVIERAHGPGNDGNVFCTVRFYMVKEKDEPGRASITMEFKEYNRGRGGTSWEGLLYGDIMKMKPFLEHDAHLFATAFYELDDSEQFMLADGMMEVYVPPKYRRDDVLDLIYSCFRKERPDEDLEDGVPPGLGRAFERRVRSKTCALLREISYELGSTLQSYHMIRT